MTESFPVSIANNILSTIALLTSQDSSSQDSSSSGGLGREIEKLKEVLLKNTGLLLNAEAQPLQYHELQDRLRKLSDLLYRVEDVFDELRCEVAKPSRKVSKKFWSWGISNDIKKIRKGLEANIMSPLSENMSEVGRINWREREINHTFIYNPQVFGRTADKAKIIEFLMEPNNNYERVSVIPILGDRGMGKSSLAKLVFNDEIVETHFHPKMWVYAPGDFALPKLLKETYISATGQNQVELTVKELEDGLIEALDGRRFLLVLDNVLNISSVKWEAFKNFLLTLSAEGSKIVVTTRNEKVANEMRSVGIENHVLQGLCQEDSMKLFMISAFGDGVDNADPELTEIGAQIVNRCNGVPLAVKTLGAILHQNVNRRDWLLIQDNHIWVQGQGGNSTLSALKLSHAYSPSHLQRCLAYCSLFPNDYRFNNNYLIHDWMALGFLATDKGNRELEDVGLQYLNALFCFFQDVENYDYCFTFKMHDYIHELVMEVAGREFKTIDLRILYAKNSIPARHLSFIGTECKDREVPPLSNNLRTIIMQSLQSKHITGSFVDKWTSKYKYLRLLSLWGLQFKVLPESVGTLKHLRCLDFSWNLILEELSKAICELQSLQTLRLLGCSGLTNFADEHMQKMSSLRYLEITTKVGRLSENVFEGLESLQFLKLYDCRYLEALPRLTSLTSVKTLVIVKCIQISSLPEGTQELTALRTLVIRNCGNLSAYWRENCSKFSHIPNLYLDPEVASSTGRQ